MVGPAWKSFVKEITLWRDLGRVVEFWWRDDDAGRPDPALSRLLKLASLSKVPLGLAAIPETSQRAIFEGINSDVVVIQHGVDHVNRSAPSEKKTEFPFSEPVDQALQRLVGGRKRLESLAGNLVIPVLVPPWNRLSPALTPLLGSAGYLGLSTFGVRKVTNPAPGVIAFNTHVDIIDWKGTRGFCGVDHALGQAIRHLESGRRGHADAREPTGWLTHHAMHDERCWTFLEELFDVTSSIEGVLWRSPADLFAGRHAT